MSKINRYTKAMRQLRSPLKESVPTNSMQGIYVDTPFVVTTPPETLIQGAQADYAQDDPASNGADTSGLFDAEGNQLTGVPPETVNSPDNSYILGPMATMWYSWGNFSTIGYIRESDRRMVNLASITGPLHTWDKTSGFNSYGQLTLEQAVWFVDNKKYGDVDNNYANANYRAYYPGPPSSSTDAFGRYLCTITGVPKDPDVKYQPPDEFTPGTNVSGDDEKSPLRNIVPGSALPDNMTAKEKRDYVKKRTEEEQALIDELKAKGDKEGLIDALSDQRIKRMGELDAAGQLGLFDQAAYHTAKTLDGIADAMSKVTDNPVANFIDNLGVKNQAAKVLQTGLEHAASHIFGADNPAQYNQQLATKLTASIVTGQTQEIKLTSSAKAAQIRNVNLDVLETTLQIGDKTVPDADNAINPTTNADGQTMKGGLLKGGWGAQGGSEVSYNPKTGELTITSNKTLRTESGGETVTRDETGKIVNFTDIPSADAKVVDAKVNAVMNNKYINNILGGMGNVFNVATGNIGGENPWDQIKNNPEALQAMKDEMSTGGNKLATDTIQSAAVNAVATREAIKKITGIGDSDVEKTGGGYGHVYSQTTYKASEIPADIKAIINKKMGKKEGFMPTHRQRKLLREVKQPYIMPEEKKVKITGYKPKLPNKDQMRQIADSMTVPERVTFAKAETGTWKAGELQKGARSSQAKKNEVLELLGQGNDSWVYMTETSRKKAGKSMYENFTLMNEQGVGTYKINRKEPLRSDYVLFLEYQDGTKSTMLQSELNEKMSDQSEKWRKDWKEPIKYEDQPAYKKVKKILSREIPLKDIQPEFPKKAPPKLDPETQMHPDMFKRHDYFTKLDPESAKSMAAAPTGDSEIDSEVEKAKKKQK